MRNCSFFSIALIILWAVPACAAPLSQDLLSRAAQADVVILGEVHDNPAHHKTQRAVLAEIHPKAVVWEMLTSGQAGRVNSALIQEPEKLEQVLEWAQSGWPSFAMYYPVFAAAPEARIYGGGVPREAALSVMQSGPAVTFGTDAEKYGLNSDLPADEAAEREALQLKAHCDAIPHDRLAVMVAIQRLRDAVLAREVIEAVKETGGPVAVITGNGHARRDWGVPMYLDRVQPDLKLFVLGQSEEGQITGVFDKVVDSVQVEREDPCKAFLNDD